MYRFSARLSPSMDLGMNIIHTLTFVTQDSCIAGQTHRRDALRDALTRQSFTRTISGTEWADVSSSCS